MRRLVRTTLLLFALCSVVSAVPATAWAGAPSLQTGASKKNVEVGRSFSVQLSAMVEATDRVPTRPMLNTPGGIVVRSGPSVMPKTQVTLNGPNLVQQMGVVVTWTLEATRPGTYRIGPPSIVWNGKRYKGSLVQVKAHRKGSLPQRRPKDPFDLFDIFGIPKMPGVFDHPRDRFDDPMLPPADPSLSMSSAPARLVFLRALVDRKQAVVGEQVTLSIYEYLRTNVRRVEVREPSAPAFLQHPILDPTERPQTKYAEVGSKMWNARLIRQVALFPLRTGDLTVGPMQITYSGRGLRTQVVRQTRPVQVQVLPAPAQGRPVGYRSGDVGRFSLQAEVEPRAVSAGDAVAVRVKLQGSGNFPATLPTPSSKGVEWLDPDVQDDIEVSRSKLRGERTFTYVVRFRDPGTIDLGEIELPYFDPERRRYRVARARLGEVKVRENPEAPARKAERDRFAELGEPRTALGHVPERGVRLTDSPYYWGVLAGSPLSVALFGLVWAFGRRVRRSVHGWRESLDRKAKEALQEAKRSMVRGDHADAASAMERAVHAGIESATSLKSRGILRDDLGGALRNEGVPDDTANEAVGLLAALEDFRFDPSAGKEEADALIQRARELLRAVAKHRRSSR